MLPEVLYFEESVPVNVSKFFLDVVFGIVCFSLFVFGGVVNTFIHLAFC